MKSKGVILKLKCTPQPEHLVEAIYLHHRAHIKHIRAITSTGEACPRPTRDPAEGRYEEKRLVAVQYTTDQVFDTSFTINIRDTSDTNTLPTCPSQS